MKKALVFITVFCMMMTMLADTLAAASYSTSKPPLSMQILGKTVNPAPIMYKNQVFLPLRALGQALGYQVNYSTKSKTMDLVSKTHNVTVTVGYINAKVNGKLTKMDLAPVLSNDTLYVPMTFVQKNFNYSVTYSSDKNLVTINKPGTQTPPASTNPSSQQPAAASNSIYVLGKKVNNGEKAQVKNGVTFVPVRLVSESLGYKVTWSSSTKTMTLTKSGQTMAMVADKTSATVNKQAVKLDAAPYLYEGRLYAPLSFVSKNLGYETTYDSKLNNVSIANKAESKPQNPPVATQPESKPGIANIVDVSYDNTSGFSQIKISADAAMESFSNFNLTNPNRLVIDIPKTAIATDYTSKDIAQDGIEKVRLGKSDTDQVRIVLDLKTQQTYKIVQSNDKKTISILYANIIGPVSYQKEGDMDVIVVKGSNALDTSVLELENPSRVVLDVQRAVFDDLLQNIPVSSDLLKAVRIGQFDVGTARVVLDVKDGVYYKVSTVGNTSKIYLSSQPFEFIKYNKYYNIAVLNLSPGKEVQYDVSVDQNNNIVNVVIPQDLKLDANRVDINDNLVKHVDYKTEVINGNKVTTASIQMQDFVKSEVISEPSTKLIKIRFKRDVTNVQQLTVVIDPGHGGKDPGANAKDGTKEKDLNLDVSLRLEKLLKAIGFNTIMTRRDDTFIELGGRTDLANSNYADFFMSVHFNAFNSSANGIETLYYPNEVNEDYTLNHRSIAEIFHSEVVKATGRKSRGITPRPNLYVLNKTKMPAILAELGFITNPEELALIKTDKYKEDAARALAVSIVKYFRDIQGVNIDIDPNSIYSWPYDGQVAQSEEQSVKQASAQVIEQAEIMPLMEEASIVPQE